MLIPFIMYNVYGGIGVSAGLHRYFTHKSYNTTPFWEKVMLFISVPATVGTPITWVAAHRIHHATSDEVNDHQSPHAIGFFNSYIHNWNNLKISGSVVSDLTKNNTIKTIHKHYIKFLLLYIIVLYSIDPLVGMLFYSIPSMFLFHSTGMVDSICHKYGYRNFETKDKSTNNTIVALLSAGEGLHNNHHKFPNMAKLSIFKNEFDWGWYFIRMIQRQK